MGWREALRGDPALVLQGGHNHAGGEAKPLDEAALSAWLETDMGMCQRLCCGGTVCHAQPGA